MFNHDSSDLIWMSVLGWDESWTEGAFLSFLLS